MICLDLGFLQITEGFIRGFMLFSFIVSWLTIEWSSVVGAVDEIMIERYGR